MTMALRQFVAQEFASPLRMQAVPDGQGSGYRILDVRGLAKKSSYTRKQNYQEASKAQSL